MTTGKQQLAPGTPGQAGKPAKQPTAEHSGRDGTRLVLPALALTTAVSALGLSIANVALPAVSAQFAIPMTTVQWATLSYLLTMTISVVLVGRLSDQFGRSIVLSLGVGLFLAGSVLAAVAPGFGVLVLARAVQGIGAAAMAALPMAVLREVIPQERTGRAMGILGSSMAAGMALGPAAGGFLVSLFGWRGVFAVLSLLAVGVYLLIRLALPAQTAAPGTSRRFDVSGATALVATLAVFSIALTLRPGGWGGAVALLALAAGLAALFVAIELRADQPLVDIRVIRAAGLVPSFVVAFLAAYVMMTFTVVPPFYLTRSLGLSDAWMGVALAVGPLAAIAAGIPAGRFVDRTDARRVAALGLGLMTVAAVAFVTLPAALGLAGFIVAALLLTPGNQLFMAGNNTATMTRAGAGQQGVVSGLLNLARNLGFTAGTGTAALLFYSAPALGLPGDDALSGLQLSFAAAAVVGVVAAGIALASARKPAAARS